MAIHFIMKKCLNHYSVLSLCPDLYSKFGDGTCVACRVEVFFFNVIAMHVCWQGHCGIDMQ